MKLVKYVALGLMTISFAHCKKDKDVPPPPTVMEMLTAGDGRWYQESSTLAVYGDCEKRSNLRLFANGNFITEDYTDPGTGCGLASTRTGTWSLLSDTEMSVTIGSNTLIYTINNLTETELAVQFTITGTTYSGSFDKTPGNG